MTPELKQPDKKKLRAALYLRVSTDEQANHGLSMDVQEKACKDALEHDGFSLLRMIRAWRRDTFRSVRRIVLPSLRPIVISSRMSGTTVVCPSSSWMTSLNMLVRVPPRLTADFPRQIQASHPG